MISGNSTPINISLPSPYPTELVKIRDLVARGDMNAIVSQYPVRESGVLGGLAKGLRFLGQQDYEKAALTRIGADKVLQSIRVASRNFLTICLTQFITFPITVRVTADVFG